MQLLLYAFLAVKLCKIRESMDPSYYIFMVLCAFLEGQRASHCQIASHVSKKPRLQYQHMHRYLPELPFL